MAHLHDAGSGRGITYGSILIAAAVAAGVLALTVRSLARRAQRAHPPAGRFLEVDGVRLHYVERGQGQPLVLLHGDGLMLQDFEASGLLERAAGSYRVIAFDRPGYGYSTRPRGRVWTPEAQARLLRQALEQLGVEHPIVVGHSWGALVALALALADPACVRGLVLLSGYYYPTFRFDVAVLSPPALPVVGDLMRYTVSPLLGRLTWPLFRRRLFGPGPVPPGFADFPVSMVLRPAQLRAAAAEAALLIPAAARLSRRYHEIAAPVAIAAGADDRYLSTRHHSLRLHEALHGSELLTAPGVGHMIHHNAPETVMAAIEAVERAAAAPALRTVDRPAAGRFPATPAAEL